MRHLLLVGVLVLAACSTPAPDPGQTSSPNPTTTQEQTTTQKTPEPKIPEVTRKEPVHWSRPCELLDLEKEMRDEELDVPLPDQNIRLYTVRIQDDTNDSCTWQYFINTHIQFRLKVSVHPSKGLDEATLDPSWERGEYTYFDITVGGREAKRVETTPSAGDCGIALPTGNGHVFVEMQAHDLLTSCIVARTAAEQIEPSLS